MKNLIVRLDKIREKKAITRNLQWITFPKDLKPGWAPTGIHWVEDCCFAIIPPEGWLLKDLLNRWSPPGGSWPRGSRFIYNCRKRPEVGSEEDKKQKKEKEELTKGL